MDMMFAHLKFVLAAFLLFCPLHTYANCKCERITTFENGLPVCLCKPDIVVNNKNPMKCQADCKCEHITIYGNGQPVCHCKPGFVVSSKNPMKCQDIDECKDLSTSPCNQICINTIGSYKCSCQVGYTINSTDFNICDDINECASTDEPVCEQICINTPGGFKCSCADGYDISTTDPTKCVDINECANTDEPVCEQNCINTPGGFKCSCADGYDISTTDPTKCVVKKYESCKEVDISDHRPVVTLTSGLQVMCDTVTDGGGWTIFQRRVSGAVDFYRSWEEYKNGFGDFSSGNFYLGNENIYLFTSKNKTELRVDMVFGAGTFFAKYSSFYISSESDGYRLHVDGYTGDYGDGLSYHINIKFSTFDRDNDLTNLGSCAEYWHGAWWYGDCYQSNLNGVWGADGGSQIKWLNLYGASFIEMKFRHA